MIRILVFQGVDRGPLDGVLRVTPVLKSWPSGSMCAILSMANSNRNSESRAFSPQP